MIQGTSRDLEFVHTFVMPSALFLFTILTGYKGEYGVKRVKWSPKLGTMGV